MRTHLYSVAFAAVLVVATSGCGDRRAVDVVVPDRGGQAPTERVGPGPSAPHAARAPLSSGASALETGDSAPAPSQDLPRDRSRAPAEPVSTPSPDKRDLGAGGGTEPLGNPPVPGSGEAKPAPDSGADEAARMVVYRGDLRVAVQDVAAAQAAAQRAVGERGGFLAALDDAGLTLRVPNARFLELVEAVAGLGVVRDRRIAGEDVTAEIADVRARLANAQAVRARLAALVEKALRIEDALAIERELARVTEQIEVLEGRLRATTSAATYATLAVRFDGPPARIAAADAVPTSTLPRAFAWVAALGEEALRGVAIDDEPSGRGPRRSLPPRFVRYHEGRDTLRALSERGVQLKLSRRANRDGADAAYWMALARRVLAADRGYALADRNDAGGAAWTEARRAVGGVERAYVLAIACDGEDVYVLEAWGAPDAVAAERESLRRAAGRLDHG